MGPRERFARLSEEAGFDAPDRGELEFVETLRDELVRLRDGPGGRGQDFGVTVDVRAAGPRHA